MISPELRARLLVAACGIPIALAAVYLGGWALAVMLSAVAALAAREFYNLSSDPGGRPFRWLGIPTSVLLVLLAAVETDFRRWSDHALALLLLLGLASFAAAVFDKRVQRALLASAATVSGALYTGGTLSFGIFIRSLPEVRGTFPAQPSEGFILLLLPVLVTWAADTCAYFAGKTLGRRKLAPHISPGKTVEGSVAGLSGAVVMGFAVGFLLDGYPNFPIVPATGALIGLLLGIAGQLGDLAESRLKREAGVKDSGSILPGHGGMLDRFDALFFTIPLAYGLIVMNRLLS